MDQAPSAAARNRRREQANSSVKLFVSSPTVTPIGGTHWAAFNAVTEFVDHVAPSEAHAPLGAAAHTRAVRTVTPGSTVQTLKAEAFRMLQAL